MCMFVFGSMCLKLLLRDHFERLIWCFGSLVELHAWLHSCLCFSLLEKLFLKAISTPSYLSSFQDFSYRNLDTSSTPGGSIKPHLLCLMFLYLDTFSTPVSIDSQILDTLLNTSQHLHLSSFTEVLYILPHVIRTSFLSISLLIALSLLSQTL